MARTYDDAAFIDSFEHGFTWLGGFMRNVRRFGGRTALIDPDAGRTWTYRALNAEANRLANALARAGIGRGDVVMTLLRNSPEFAFCYCGIRKIGAVMLAANFNLAPGEAALLSAANRPKAVVCSPNAARSASDFRSSSADAPALFVLADNREGIPLPEGFVLYEDFVSASPVSEPGIGFRPHIYDEVLRLCTSGTTALPKSVPVNDVNEVLSAHDVMMSYPMDFRDVTLNMTPWFHRGGCHSGGLCPSLYAGAAACVMRSFRPQSALDWVSRFGLTFLMGAPANLAMLARVQERSPRDLSRLRGIVAMGAPLSRADCVRYMEVLTPNIFNGYGTTETFWNSFLRPCDLPDGAGTVGGSCTDDEVRVVRISGGRTASPEDTVPQDGVSEGEIIVRAPGKATLTYIGGEELSRERFRGGWTYTGDTGTWTEGGVVTVRGRKDNMMVVSGENIYPSQVEDALNECPRVRDSLVTSVPDKIRGQAVAAYVVPADPALTVRDLAEFCAGSRMLSSYKRPRFFALVGSLPLTATGKKRRAEMRLRAERDLRDGILRKE